MNDIDPLKIAQAREVAAQQRDRQNFRFTVREAVKDIMGGLTLNGYPIDFEGNNMRVQLSTERDHEAIRQPPIRPPAPTSSTPEMTPTAPQAYHHTSALSPLVQVARATAAFWKRWTADRKREDTTDSGAVLLPVHFRRADKKFEVLGFLQTPSSFRATKGTLPPKDKYYEATGAGTEHYSFQIVDASDDSGPKILIYDGQINDELPSGMGGDNYILGASNGMEIWAIITYDTTTFAITSRTLGFSGGDDTLGTLHILIGGVAIDSEGTVKPYNAHCGDIHFTFDFGGLNGQPAVKLTPFGDWVELTF